jgi:hypothetical protein
MTRLQALGFFCELRHGDPQGPSIHDAVATPLPEATRTPVARYLADAPIMIATTALADDILDPSRTDVSGISVHTDGTFVWSEDLAYYVRTYGALVPDALVQRAISGSPPDLSDDELMALAEVFAPAP